MSAQIQESDNLREQAVKRLKNKRDFRMHLLIYGGVNTFLVVVWAMVGGGVFWPIFSIVGWGIGLVAHAWDAYGPADTPTESQISREIERLSKRS